MKDWFLGCPQPWRLGIWQSMAAQRVSLTSCLVGQVGPTPNLNPADFSVELTHERVVNGDGAYIKANSPKEGHNFGGSLAMSGGLLAVGAIGDHSGAVGINGDQDDSSAYNSGAVFIYQKESNWNWKAYLKAPNPDAWDNFYRGLALEGGTLVVGAVGEDSTATGIDGDMSNNSGDGVGAAYIFSVSP